MPLVQTRGAASAQGFGEFAQATVANYIESVFSTYLYTGTGGAQTITNGIDLSGKGGLVWTKARNTGAGLTREQHWLFDSARITAGGNPYYLNSNNTDAQGDLGGSGISFTSTGFSILDNYLSSPLLNYVSWTFREQAKFFDVVTWTGNGTAGRQIPHNLGSAPGFVVVKRTSNVNNWICWHRALTSTQYIQINSTSEAFSDGGIFWNSTIPSATDLTLGSDSGVNGSGSTYVAYLFAHDAGGFGLTGTDNVISCGSYTGNGSANGPIVNLGYEPQWVLTKGASTNANYAWQIVDNMRGIPMSGNTQALFPNSSGAESAWQLNGMQLSATGFQITSPYAGVNASGETYIYIAIRRGPMKVPTLGTSVFGLDASSAGGSGGVLGAITASDLVINSQRDPAANSPFVFIDRLRGVGQPNTGSTTRALYSSNTNAETTVDSTSTSSTAEGVNGANLTSSAGRSSAIRTVQQGPGGSVAYNLIRAPGFFDEVCYTGTGSATTFSHNLTVAPEMMIIKNRSSASHWIVYTAALGNTKALEFTTSGPTTTAAFFNNTSPTSSVFTVNSTASVNGSGSSLVAYLFATCAGVSKVGSYTGNGTTQTINCGFTGGARFVLIKRTDSTGDWYVWDSARGIVAGNDPYLLLNSAAAEVTSTDYIDTASTGFEISSTAPAAINANGGSFIFLAIA
jgi:hypothetical protein